MRPTTSTMLQQNNNNNYPCLTMSGTTRDMLQKCSRAALPFPSRMELGDLPLIRGLRAWALCSRNRRKAGGLLGGGQSPTAPPAGHRKSTSCPKPADVYLSGEWGRMGYGLPLGLDARQAEIGALVTVATLKTSEGSGKTQTQCLFLRTEKGSCLYSTAKPGPGVATGAACSVVGGWLRGTTGGGGGGGGGGRDTPAGRRDSGPSPLAQTGANRVRVRSGRRWRKSSNAAGREKPVVSRERQHRSREDPAGEIILEERKEVQDKGALDSKQFPSLQQDNKKGQQEKEGACRTPRCTHNASPKTCTQCGKRAQRRESQEEHETGESPSSEMKGMRKQKQNVEEEEEKEEEEEGGRSCELGSTNFLLAVPACDLESSGFHPESLSGCNVEEIREAESNKEQDSHSKEKENHCEEVNVNGLPSPVEANEKCEKASMESADVEVEERSISQTSTESPAVSNLHQDVSVFTCPAFISSACCPESSPPVEGSGCAAPWVQRELGSHQDEQQQGEGDPGIVGNEELDVSRFEPQELNFVADEKNAVTVNKNRKPQVFFKNEKSKASSSPFRRSSTSVADGMIIIENSGDCRMTESEQRDELVSEEDDTEERISLDGGDEAGGNKLDGGKGDNKKEQHTNDVINASTKLENNYEIERNCAPKDDWSLQESADGCRKQEKDDGDACGQISIAHVETRAKSSTNVACADPPLANPAPSLPPLGSMVTGLPHMVAEEEEEDGVRVTARDGEKGQEGKRRHRGELEEHGEGERGSTVATVEERKEEEEEEDEFGVFMQAEGEPACSEGFTVSPSVPCGSRANVALGNHVITGESIRWTPGWTGSPFHQSDDAWTAFPQDPSDGGREAVEQWWPSSAVEERRLSASHNLVSVFAEAFPSLPGSSSNDPCDLDTVPTLTQLLRCRASRDQGLLDSFHDLNKMIGQRYKRASGVSRDLLLKTLHLEQPQTESRPAPWTASRRLSPGLPSANQRTQNAAAKRRLSYDYNRNIMD